LNRGHRIVELRNLLVLAQKELASVIGIAQSYLSDLERGRLELTPAAIHRICAATATPASFFQFSTPPYSADDINFRTHTRMVGAKQQDFVVQAFKEIERISAMLAQAPVVRVKRVVIPFAGHADLSDHDLELLAGDIRAAGMSRWPAASPRASVGFVAGMVGDRQRFTLAHEFGHIVLHSRRSVSDRKQREREADYFAGALLLPRPYAQHTITESLTLHDYLRIKAEFGISLHAIITRAQRLGLITWDRQHSLMLQLSTCGWRHHEPVHVDPESPLLLHSELVALHGAHPYPAGSSALGISPTLLESWIPEPNDESDRKDSEATPPQRLRL
jgi:transcriptional regulator with XRE-family HTH domain